MSTSQKPRFFRCLVGQKAANHLAQAGCGPDSFRLLLAASGGPRWLGLVGIDRALTRFLRLGRSERLPLLGSSSGAWRVAAMAADDDGSAYNELEQAYISQRYEGKPTPAEVSHVCRQYLGEIFTAQRLHHAVEASPFQANFSTAIFRRELPSKSQTLGNILALPLLNALDRRLMGAVMARGLFSAGPHPPNSPILGAPYWDGFPTRAIALNEHNFVPALLASGSIPFVLEGESAIPGAGSGHHFDGGLIDYHFEVETAGPVIYPHFSDNPLPSWMDRFPPFRRLSRLARSQLCLLLPSEYLLSRYPDQKYPSRTDFHKFSNDERIRRWRAIVDENAPLERELNLCLECNDLLRIAEPFG